MKTRDKILFLNELADLLDKHEAAICSKKQGEKYSTVFFQFSRVPEQINIDAGRCHYTAYDLRSVGNRLIDELDKKLEEMRIND